MIGNATKTNFPIKIIEINNENCLKLNETALRSVLCDSKARGKQVWIKNSKLKSLKTHYFRFVSSQSQALLSKGNLFYLIF